ncbi:MAG TPA: LacI family DNA-binding transcriptional regulator [Burkholderiaceae bacterium]
MTSKPKPAPVAAPTMAALAERAGVSKITVSRALRDSPQVTPDTKALVRRVAEEMGYRFNHSARNLRLQRSHTVAVVVDMQPSIERPMSEPFPLYLLAGIAEALTNRGFSVLLTPMGSLRAGLPLAADGLILLGQGPHDEAFRQAAESGLPMVVWGADAGNTHALVVGSDNFAGGQQVAAHFASRGCKQALFIGDLEHAEIEQRFLGLQQGLKPGVTLEHLAPGAFTFKAGMDVLHQHLPSLKPGKHPLCIFAANDLLAMGAVRALLDAGWQLPQQACVIGCDNTPSGASFAPALSSLSQDWQRGGQLLAELVLDLIEGRPAASVHLPTSLVVRAT